MSTSSVEVIASNLQTVSQPTKTSPAQWQVELWKLFRQLWPIAAFAIVSVFFIQLMCLRVMLTSQYTGDEASAHTALYQAPVYSGLIFTIGVVCLCLGVDTENRNWHWRTSLPGSWQSDLKTKLGIGIAGAVFCWLMNLGLGFAVDLPLSSVVLNDNQWQTIIYGTLGVAVISVPSLAVLATALLLFESTGVGIGIGTLTAFLLQGMYLVVAEQLELPVYPWWIVTVSLVTILLSSVAVFTYQWRWQSGLFWTWERGVDNDATAKPVLLSKASFFQSQLRQTLRHLRIPLSILVTIIALRLIFMLPAIETYRSWLQVEPFTILASILLGTELFTGDRSRNHLAFFSDRGVSVFSFWFTRITIGLGLASVLLLISWATEPVTAPVRLSPVELTVKYSISCGVIFLLSLTQLCFRSWLSSVGVAGIWFLVAAYVFVMQYEAVGLGGVVVSVASLILVSLPFSYRALAANFRDHEAKTIRYFVGFSLCFLLVNVLAFPVLRIISVPSANVPMHVSIDESQSAKKVLAVLPKFSSLNEDEIDLEDAMRLALLAPQVAVTGKFDEMIQDVRPDVNSNQWDEAKSILRDNFYRDFVYSSRRLDQPRSIRQVEIEAQDSKRIRELLTGQCEGRLEQIRELLDHPETANIDSFRIVEQKEEAKQAARLLRWLAQVFVISASAKEDDLAIEVLEMIYEIERRYMLAIISWGVHPNENASTLGMLPDVDWIRLLEKEADHHLDPPLILTSDIQTLSRRLHRAQLLALTEPPSSRSPNDAEYAKYHVPLNLVFEPSSTSDFEGLVSLPRQWLGSGNNDQWPWERIRRERHVRLSFQNSEKILEQDFWPKPIQQKTDPGFWKRDNKHGVTYEPYLTDNVAIWLQDINYFQSFQMGLQRKLDGIRLERLGASKTLDQ